MMPWPRLQVCESSRCETICASIWPRPGRAFAFRFQARTRIGNARRTAGREAGSKISGCRAKLWQGIALRNLGDVKRRSRLVKNRDGFRHRRRRFSAASRSTILATRCMNQGDLAGARKIYEEVLRIDREIGIRAGQPRIRQSGHVIGDQAIPLQLESLRARHWPSIARRATGLESPPP